MQSVDVIVVGAGPVGLALAIELGWNGVKVLLAEKGDGTVSQPKMDILSVRTMEFCRRWGIRDRVLASGYNRDYPQDYAWVTALNGHELGREPFPSSSRDPVGPESPEKRERCPQNFFDPVLAQRVSEFANVQVRHRTEFLHLHDSGSDIRAAFRDSASGEQFEVGAAYLAGCDGGASNVRNQLGISTVGGDALTYTTNVIFRCADFAELHSLAPAYRYIFIGPEGTWGTIVAIDGRDTYRFSLIGDSNRQKPDAASLRTAIERAMGRPFAFEILSIMPWVRKEMVAHAYRKGRAFLVGDAAHLNSPTGGFGMNTGLQDAVDLGWKLAAVIQGWGGDALLDSYEEERLPVALRNVREATANLQRMLSSREDKPCGEVFTGGEAGAAARKAYGDGYTQMMKPEWFTTGVHLGYRYTDSKVIIPDGTDEPPDTFSAYEPTARPGHRAPHAWIEPGTSVLDLFERRFTLLNFGAEENAKGFEAVAIQKGMPLRLVVIADPDIAAAYGEVPLVLVRPDGFVAWRGSAPSGREVGRILDTVRGVFETSQQTEVTQRELES